MKDKKFIKQIIVSILFIFLLYGIFYFISPVIKKIYNKKEGFSRIDKRLTPGQFPETVDKPLLDNFYPLKDNYKIQGISNNTYKDNYSLYPSYSASDCETNNKKFWTLPDNGLCSRAEMCETLYNKKTIKKYKISEPSSNCGVRVNYYNSHT